MVAAPRSRGRRGAKSARARAAALAALLAPSAFANEDDTVTVEVVVTTFLELGACANLCAPALPTLAAGPGPADVTLTVPASNPAETASTKPASCPVCPGTVFAYQPTDVPFYTLTSSGDYASPTVSIVEPTCATCHGTVIICEPTRPAAGSFGLFPGHGPVVTEFLPGANEDGPAMTLVSAHPGVRASVIVGFETDVPTLTLPNARPSDPTVTLRPTGRGQPPVVVVGKMKGVTTPTITIPGAGPDAPWETLPPAGPGAPAVVVKGEIKAQAKTTVVMPAGVPTLTMADARSSDPTVTLRPTGKDRLPMVVVGHLELKGGVTPTITLPGAGPDAPAATFPPTVPGALPLVVKGYPTAMEKLQSVVDANGPGKPDLVINPKGPSGGNVPVPNKGTYVVKAYPTRNKGSPSKAPVVKTTKVPVVYPVPVNTAKPNTGNYPRPGGNNGRPVSTFKAVVYTPKSTLVPASKVPVIGPYPVAGPDSGKPIPTVKYTLKQPVYEVPVKNTKLPKQPVYEVPVKTANLPKQSVYEVPVKSTNLPVYEVPVKEQPVYEVPVKTTNLPGQSVYEVPVKSTNLPKQPVYEVPVKKQPVYEIPVKSTNIPKQPVYEVPVKKQPVYEVPVKEQPVYEVPVKKQPVYEVPVKEQPVYEVPVKNTNPPKQPAYGAPRSASYKRSIYPTSDSTEGCQGCIISGGIDTVDSDIDDVDSALDRPVKRAEADPESSLTFPGFGPPASVAVEEDTHVTLTGTDGCDGCIVIGGIDTIDSTVGDVDSALGGFDKRAEAEAGHYPGYGSSPLTSVESEVYTASAETDGCDGCIVTGNLDSVDSTASDVDSALGGLDKRAEAEAEYYHPLTSIESKVHTTSAETDGCDGCIVTGNLDSVDSTVSDVDSALGGLDKRAEAGAEHYSPWTSIENKVHTTSAETDGCDGCIVTGNIDSVGGTVSDVDSALRHLDKRAGADSEHYPDNRPFSLTTNKSDSHATLAGTDGCDGCIVTGGIDAIDTDLSDVDSSLGGVVKRAEAASQ